MRWQRTVAARDASAFFLLFSSVGVCSPNCGSLPVNQTSTVTPVGYVDECLRAHCRMWAGELAAEQLGVADGGGCNVTHTQDGRMPQDVLSDR